MSQPQPGPWQPPQQWGPPPGYAPPAKPARNVVAIVSVVCAGLAVLFINVALIVFPLGVAAVVTGAIGENHARKRGLKLGRLAMLGLVVGLIEIAGVLINVGVL